MLAGSVYAQELGIQKGPFDLQFNTSEGTYVYEYKPVLDNPICDAISNQRQLEMTIDKMEKISDKEIRIVSKRVVVEPYAFGINSDGKPILRGNVVEEKVLKKVTVKFEEEQADEDRKISREWKQKGFFSGWLMSDNNQKMEIRRVGKLRVVEGSHFDIPKNFKGIEGENIQVICQLPVSK